MALPPAIQKLRNHLRVFCGWFAVYIALGALAGLAITAPLTIASECRPSIGAFALITSHCADGYLNFFWDIILGFPRFFILPPALSLALFIASATQASGHYFDAAICWLLPTIPFALFLTEASRYWKQRAPRMRIVLLAVFIVEIIVVALRE